MRTARRGALMQTPNFGFDLLGATDQFNIVSGLNTPITQIDTELAKALPLDTEVTSGSTKAVTSGAISASLDDLKTRIDSEFPIGGSSIQDHAIGSSKLANGTLFGRFRKCVFIGDSWGAGFNQGADHRSQGVSAYLAEALGCELVDKSVSATGYVTTTTPTYQTQVESVTASEAENVDLVVIEGGQNDQGNFNNDLINAVRSCVNTAANKFVNARIVIVNTPISYGMTLGHYQTETFSVAEFSLAATRERIEFGALTSSAVNRLQMINGCYLWGTLFGTFGKSVYIDDAWHLTAAGYQAFSYLLAQCIYNGCDYWPVYTSNAIYTNMSASFRYPRATTQNGITTIDLIAQTTAECSIGQYVDYPFMMAPGGSMFVSGVCPTTTGVFFAIDPLPDSDVVRLSVQGANIPSGEWIFIHVNWPTLG